jgi:two-component system phosphate regulon sensor histidine kinase PhoR
MASEQFETVIEAVPEPMLHLDAAGRDRGVQRGGARCAGQLDPGRSYATVLRQPSILGRIETVQVDGTAGEARFELADTAGSTQFRVRITALGGADVGARDIRFCCISPTSPICAKPRRCAATSSPM